MSEEKKPFRPMRALSLCLSDVPEEAYINHANGKVYINFINEEKEPDQYGNDQMLYIPQTAEQRANHTPKVFCGRGRTLGQKNNYQNKKTQAAASNNESNNESNMKGNPDPNEDFDDKTLPF